MLAQISLPFCCFVFCFFFFGESDIVSLFVVFPSFSLFFAVNVADVAVVVIDAKTNLGDLEKKKKKRH
jgi:hypothetical protein